MNQNIYPLISIITVVYNGANTLNQTIQSVLNQTYKNIEYIIIDGGSKDGTLDIIKSYENQISLWVSEPDKGLYDAMNKGIKLANGELIGMINSDDWYELNAVELIVESYIQNPNKQIFHGDRFDVFEDETRKVKKFHPSRFKFIYYGMTYNHPSMFIHRDIYANELYNIKLKALSDYEFVLKHFLNNETIFHYIPKTYVNYRLDGISAKMKFAAKVKEGYISRKNANLQFLHRIFSTGIRIIVFTLYRYKK